MSHEHIPARRVDVTLPKGTRKVRLDDLLDPAEHDNPAQVAYTVARARAEALEQGWDGLEVTDA